MVLVIGALEMKVVALDTMILDIKVEILVRVALNPKLVALFRCP